MKVVIIFSSSDDTILISAIRGIAAQIEGFHTVKDQTNLLVKYTEEMEFEFSEEHNANRFQDAVRKYIAKEFQQGIRIEISN